MKNIWLSILTHILVLIIGIFATLLGKLSTDLTPVFVQNILPLISKKVFAELLAITLMLLLILLFLVAYIYYKKFRVKHYFGINWDKNRTPHCVNCNSILTIRIDKDVDKNFCLKCKEYIQPIHIRGIPLDIDSVHNILLQDNWFKRW